MTPLLYRSSVSSLSECPTLSISFWSLFSATLSIQQKTWCMGMIKNTEPWRSTSLARPHTSPSSYKEGRESSMWGANRSRWQVADETWMCCFLTWWNGLYYRWNRWLSRCLSVMRMRCWPCSPCGIISVITPRTMQMHGCATLQWGFWVNFRLDFSDDFAIVLQIPFSFFCLFK